MRRPFLAALALCLAAAPYASAQAAPLKHHESRPGAVHIVKPGHGKVVIKKTVVKPRWTRGTRLPAWERKAVVRDYRGHGLRRPGRGQEWVRIGRDFVLVSLRSHVIVTVVAAR